QARWRFDGQRFRLVRYAAEPTCDKKEKENAIAHGRYDPRSSNKQHKSYLRCAGSAAQSDLSD
ncbi:hypothetical protein ACUOA5_43655, partial [Escherichia coli]